MYHKLNLVEKLSFLSIFFILALLLSTDNFSVVIAALTVVGAIFILIKERVNIAWDRFDKVVLVIFSAYLVSNIPLAILDWGNMRYFRGASRIILCLPLYFFLKYAVRTEIIYANAIFWGIFSGSIGAFLIAMYQFFVEEVGRVGGFLYSINFGYLSCTLSILALSLFRNQSHRKITSISLALSCTATLMTLSRGAILALPAIILIAYLLNYKKIKLSHSIVGFFSLIVLSLSVYYSSPKIQTRVDFTVYEITEILSGKIEKAESSGARLMLWKASVEAFKQNPLIGLTHPEREALNKALAENGEITQWAAGVPRGHAHSQYFDMLASGGILGVTAIIFMVFVPLMYFLKHAQSSQSAYMGALFVSGFAIFNLTEVPLQQNLISTFYGYMLAVFLAAAQLELKNIGSKNV